MRRQDQRLPNKKQELYRVNEDIRVPQVRVVDEEGNQLGVMTPQEGIDVAAERGLDLVEVAAQAKPPVCKIMNYDKFRYEQTKRQGKQKSARVQLKTIRMRPQIDEHDIQTKVRKASSFLEKGDRVRFEMRLRGRENAHVGLWIDKMVEVTGRLNDVGELVARPRKEGRMIFAMMEPLAETSSNA